MVKRAFFVIWLVLSVLLSFVAEAGKFKVHGRAEGIIGETVRIIVPSDPFSGRELSLASAITDSLGYFSLQADITRTQFGWLSLGFGRSEIYLYPGLDLEIRLLTPGITIAGRNPFLEPPLLSIELIREQPNALNRDITIFNAFFDDFVVKCGPGLHNRRNKTLTDSLNRLVRELPLDTANPYLQQYILYKLADIHVFLREMRYPAAYKKYLENRIPDFSNVAYSDFFNSFFDDYLFSRSKAGFLDDLDLCINKNVDYAGLIDSLGKDSLLRNERIRELVLLKHLRGLYYDKNYSGANVLYMLTMLAEKTKFTENRHIAGNLKYMLTRYDANSAIPAFQFRSSSGEIITEKSLEEGISCLIFFRNACDLCDAEHEMIQALHRKYGNKVRFLSVCCDPGGFGLISYLRNHPAYTWEFADFNGDYGFLESMGIRSFPLFLLSGKDARILKYPARKPSERLEMDLDRLTAP